MEFIFGIFIISKRVRLLKLLLYLVPLNRVIKTRVNQLGRRKVPPLHSNAIALRTCMVIFNFEILINLVGEIKVQPRD